VGGVLLACIGGKGRKGRSDRIGSKWLLVSIVSFCLVASCLVLSSVTLCPRNASPPAHQPTRQQQHRPMITKKDFPTCCHGFGSRHWGLRDFCLRVLFCSTWLPYPFHSSPAAYLTIYILSYSSTNSFIICLLSIHIYIYYD
jgi:hypothetical protein